MRTTTEAVRENIARVETRRVARAIASQAVHFTSTRQAGWDVRRLLDLEAEAWTRSMCQSGSLDYWADVRESTFTALVAEADMLEYQVAKKVGV